VEVIIGVEKNPIYGEYGLPDPVAVDDLLTDDPHLSCTHRFPCQGGRGTFMLILEFAILYVNRHPPPETRMRDS